MSFYLARLEAAQQQHRMMEAAAAAAGHAHAPRAWPPSPYPQHAALLPRPDHPPAPPPPLNAGRRVDTWRGSSVARRDDGAPLRAGGSLGDGAGVASSATVREEKGHGGDEPLNKRTLAPTPPPKRRAVAARRLFPPGCGRDVALPFASADDDASRSVAARVDGGSGAPHKSALPPRPALAGGKVDSVFFEATSSPSAAAAASAGGSSSISALEKVSASGAAAAGVTTDDGGHHYQGESVTGLGSGQLLTCEDCLVPSARLLPKPTTVSANRCFPPGCQRLGGPLPAGGGTTYQVVVCLPSSEEVVPAERGGAGAAQNEGSQEDGTLHEDEATACTHGASVPAISASVPATSAAESLAQGLSKEGHRSDNVPDCATMDTTSSAGVSGEDAVTRKKIMLMHTPRKSVRPPPRLIQKSLLHTQRRDLSMEIERETELGWSVNMNGIEDTGEFTKDRAIQDPMSANKSPQTNGNEAAFFGPKKRVKNKKKLMNKRRVTVKGPTSACALDEDSILEDDEIFKALAAYETQPQSADARSKVKLICTRFESICRAIVQATGHRSMKVRRIDLAADKLMRRLPGFTKQGPVVGSVPGVQVGDEFLYRVQLALVGLHRPYQGGIDFTSHESGVRIAISVVASGGYPDQLSCCSGELVYTGSGKKCNGDQKLEHGNLALKNCIQMKTPVRVIHGFKDHNREEGSHSRAREISTFTYDGLYHVVNCWREGSPGSKVFKYKLQRIPGQPQL